MIRSIVLHPDPVLRQVAEPVTSIKEHVADLISELFEAMYAALGRGLAAPQLGVSQRICVIDAGWKDGSSMPFAFVNPIITDRSEDMQINEEACLSIPGQARRISRPAWIEVRWWDQTGEVCARRFEGFEAACLCHEIDHLNGHLILDLEEAA